MKRPAYQWYPGDHRRDTAVQACSFEARALWREMLDLMHDGEPRGYLTAGGVAITPEQLARLVGETVPRVKKWLAELEERKVFSRTEAGVIYSRRMVKDEHVSQVRREAGKHGGNPELVKQPAKQAASGLVKQNGKQNPTPAVAVGGLRSAVASSPLDLDQESSNTRSGDLRRGESLREPPAPRAVARNATAPGELPPAAEQLLDERYARRGVSPAVLADKRRQLLTLATGGVVRYKGQPVHAFTVARLDAKCRDVLNEPIDDPDATLAVLLLKLGDTSDGSAPGIAQADADRRAADDAMSDLDPRAAELIGAVVGSRGPP